MKTGSPTSQKKFLASKYNFIDFIKSNKIPEYATNYKREYQFIRGYIQDRIKELNNSYEENWVKLIFISIF